MAVGDEEKGYGSVEPSAAAPRAEPSAEAERSTRREARLHVAGVTTVVLICSALIFGAVMYFPAQANAHAPVAVPSLSGQLKSRPPDVGLAVTTRPRG